VDRHEDIAGVLDVPPGDLPEYLFRVVHSPGELLELLVVEVGAGYGLLEDSRVGGNARDPVFYHTPETAVLYVLTREFVDPGRLPHLTNLPKTSFHLWLLKKALRGT